MMPMLRFIKTHALFTAGLAIVALVSCAAAAAPFLTECLPETIDLTNILSAPSKAHPFGTDALGRDVFARMLYGARVSLVVGFSAVGISLTIGTALGLISGYYRGIVDELIMRIVDIMLCFPSFFLILAVIAILEPSLSNIMIVIGFTSWMGVARLVRAETLSIRGRDHVSAALMNGCDTARVLFRHILPNIMAPVLVTATLGVAGAILTESSLSFLGLGVQPPDPSWGNILMEGKDVIEIAPWISLFPGLAILITVLGYNLLGESLRDMLDPRLRQSVDNA
ncbi:MAG: ABC transporter permease [Mailhella sp.]|nr:ABC transporter permease [Mailhella sp.]